jgi:hypothetical protein
LSAAAAAVLSGRAATSDARRIGVLFMVGSACFAVASIPGATSASPEAVGVVYFVGSIFFTLAACEQMRTSPSDPQEALAAVIQFAGTLFFNWNTFGGMREAFGNTDRDLLVWTPDAVGSICFLVSSVLAALAARVQTPDARRIAALNLIGSAAFGLAAIAAFTLPATDQLLDASLASSGTLVGAICFFIAAYWLVPRGRGGS